MMMMMMRRIDDDSPGNDEGNDAEARGVSLLKGREREAGSAGWGRRDITHALTCGAIGCCGSNLNLRSSLEPLAPETPLRVLVLFFDVMTISPAAPACSLPSNCTLVPLRSFLLS